MKTEDLIALMAKDAGTAKPLGPAFAGWLALGALASLLLLIVLVGLRPDIAVMIATPRVAFKITVTLLLAAAAILLARRVGEPGAALRPALLLLGLAVLVLLGGVAAELAALPRASWTQSLLGQHARFCMAAIPSLSLLPLAGLMLALKRGAPDHPALAGAGAGLAAGAAAAAIYAWHCPDDSPLFVACWYMLSILIVTLAGSLIGARALRW
ncbi:hypothetical protein M2360_003829 [Rhizobium sp. SG_E_25_P2]|uniref:DUF1109 domain-containing protein n=1 Tax=Rhizobium sp. SG_E_25_P2 TaxID=2879942 RepID=UPI002474F99E|nr:DUF1109 domain-containing protein [Rhizobium sp. SG_E_25_P2]MDH6268424.1 hypothetical protein [Rhizobium sp. SG_E_25_P2]